MMSRKSVLAVACLVSACAGSVPDSNPYAGGGVGFGGYDSYEEQRAARDVALARGTMPVSQEQVIASETMGVLNATRPGAVTPLVPVTTTGAVATTAVATTAVTTTAVAPAPGTSNPGISDEQNFDAVSSRETIESDAQRLARQRQEYQVIPPQAVPERPGNRGPNIVAFALETTNRVGEQVYRRSGNVSDSKFQRACARYSSSDQAQEAFLSSGGPRNDRNGVDPDGDGFACYWDPSPFRAARGG